jgi:hypothetical protein
MTLFKYHVKILNVKFLKPVVIIYEKTKYV